MLFNAYIVISYLLKCSELVLWLEYKVINIEYEMYDIHNSFYYILFGKLLICSMLIDDY